jgi:hypothetical protein
MVRPESRASALKHGIGPVVSWSVGRHSGFSEYAHREDTVPVYIPVRLV